jgi:hypothetical protein
MPPPTGIIQPDPATDVPSLRTHPATLPESVYSPEHRGVTVAPVLVGTPGDPYREFQPRLLAVADLPDYTTGPLAQTTVTFGHEVTALRITLPTEGMVLVIGWGRSVSPTDYDDVVRYDPGGTIVPVPAGMSFTVANIGAVAADELTVVVGLSRSGF